MITILALVLGFGFGVFSTWFYFAVTIIGGALGQEPSE